MRRKILYVSLVLLASLSSISIAFAQTGLPGGGWWSGETIQNIGTSAASVILTAYDSASSNTYTASANIAAGDKAVFTPSNFSGMPSGFQGSAVVSSDQPIAAVVNITNRPVSGFGITGGKAAALYQGINSTSVATSIYFPLVKAGHYNKTTSFYVQNAGSSATTLNAVFRMNDGNTYNYTSPSIGPNQMVVFSVFDSPTYNVTGLPANDPKRIGSLEVNASVPIAGVVMEHFTSENPATIAQTTKGFTSNDFSSKAYAPQIKHNWYGRFTGIMVQNVSSSSINVTVTYKGSGGTCIGNTYTDSYNNLQPGKSTTFVQYEGQTNLPSNCLASATIEGSGNILAVVNESYRGDSIPPSGQRSVTYSAIPNANVTTKVSVPLFKNDRYGKRTGLLVQNVGSVDATHVVATFKCSGGSTFTAITNELTIPAGASILFITPHLSSGVFTSSNPFPSADVDCSVTIVGDQPIVAVANESVVPSGTLDQDTSCYEGFNLTP